MRSGCCGRRCASLRRRAVMLTKKEIGARIRWRREAVGLSQVTLAARVGTSHASISDAENGYRLLAQAHQGKLGLVLGTTWEELAGIKLETCPSCGHWLLKDAS